VKVIGGTLGVAGGGEYRPLVVTQDLQPRSDIRGVILADFGCDAKVGTEEGCTYLGVFAYPREKV
jgi:hypothetical protein